jgi:hypothetical protein
MEDWDRCPRLYDLRHNKGYRPIMVNAALGYGGLIHAGLDTWYSTKNFDMVIAALGVFEYDPPIGDFRTKERAVKKLTEYIGFYQEEEAWLDEWNNIIVTETAFDLEDSDGFRWGGKMDLLVLSKDFMSPIHRPWVMDHKTTSRFGDSWFDQFEISSQMAGYCWAAGQMHDSEIAGVIVNCIVTHKVAKPPEKQLHRQNIFYPQWKIDEWKAARIKDYWAIHSINEMGAEYHCRWKNCIDKYGKCPFYQVCRAQPESREILLETQYVIDPWDWRTMDD